MAICPFAVKRLLPESVTQPRIKPRVFIMHSAAGRGSLYNFFLNSSSLESHFWIASDGTIEQYIDTEVRADANLKANSFAISVETESSPAATEPWTEAQAISLVRLGDWAATTHGIPRKQVEAWDGSGFGWHIMFGAPGPWTPVAKSCPGPARIEQAKNVIIPSIREAGRVLPSAEEGLIMDKEVTAAFAAVNAKLDRIIASERTNTARTLENTRGLRKILAKFGLSRKPG